MSCSVLKYERIVIRWRATAINFNFAAFSIYLDDIFGQIFVLFILTIAATESAIGLSLLTIFYRLKNSIELQPVKRKITNKI